MATKTKAKKKIEKLAETKPKRKPPKFVPRAEVAAAYNPDNPYSTWRGTKSYLRAYNPDDLVKSRSNGIQIYQEMTREPVVKAALMQKITSLLSVPWGVKPASPSAVHVEQAKFVEWNLKNLHGGFTRDVYEMCDALRTGYSIQEKIYEIITSGQYAGMVRLAALKSKDPYYFGFAFDEFMNLNADGVIMILGAVGKQNVPLPADKFFIFSYLKIYENLYGQSDLRAAYRAYWIKDTAWKLRSIYMERFSGNNLKAKYPRNKHAQQNKEALLDIFRAWQNETGVAIPDDLEIEVMQIATSTDSEYARAMADCNKDMAIGILGETLTMDEGRKTGARNMGEIHKKVVDLFVQFLDMILTADINEHIIRDIVDTNYVGTTEYPVFYWYPREDYDPVKFGEAVQKWQEAGAKISKSWFYERTRMPIPAGEGDVLKPPKPEPAPNPFGNPGQATPTNREDAKDAKGNNGDGNGAAKMAESSNGKYYRDLTQFESFAEIPKVDLRMRRMIDRAVEKSQPAYDRIFDSIATQVEKKEVLDKQDYDAAARIAVNPSPLKASIFRGLLTANMMGRADVVIETQNQGFDFGRVRKFAEARFDWDVVDEPFTPEEVVAFFSGKVPMTKEEFNALSEQLLSEAFYVAGLEKTNIDRDVKSLLTDALKNGKTLEEFKFQLNELGVKYAAPVYGRVGDVGDDILDYHAETVFRTNMMSAYNQGKFAMYQDPEIKEYFPAYEYTAAMDNRTSDICSNLDGTRRLADDPIWKEIWPPNHFNCRSTVVSINKYDFNRDMITTEETATPAEGFGG